MSMMLHSNTVALGQTLWFLSEFCLKARALLSNAGNMATSLLVISSCCKHSRRLSGGSSDPLCWQPGRTWPPYSYAVKPGTVVLSKEQLNIFICLCYLGGRVKVVSLFPTCTQQRQPYSSGYLKGEPFPTAYLAQLLHPIFIIYIFI